MTNQRNGTWSTATAPRLIGFRQLFESEKDRADAAESRAAGLAAGRQQGAAGDDKAQLAFHRKQASNIIAATGMVRHTNAKDCEGCGCMSLSAEEAVAYLVADRDRLLAVEEAAKALMALRPSPLNPVTDDNDALYSRAVAMRHAYARLDAALAGR